tara:strand:+ start:170 stop:841 length:672 start_codon:yes stop_codon:yes gene_type:complete
MFKKIIIAAISASFLASAAFADSTNIGVRFSSADLSASGSENTNLAGTNLTQKEREASFEMPSIFVERQFETNSMLNIAVGLDFVPLTEDVATLGGGDGTDAKVKAGNLITAYIQPSISFGENISVFGKIGYAQGDLDINDMTRQASSHGTAVSTDLTTSKSLRGPVLGLGVQFNKDMGPFSFVRLEATRTDFDEINHTNSNGKKLKADAEMELVSLTIGKNF